MRSNAAPLVNSRRPRGDQLPRAAFGLNVPTRLDNSNRPTLENKLNPVQGYLGPTIPGARPYITTNTRDDFMAAFNKRANYHSEERVAPHIMKSARRMIKSLCPCPMPRFEWDDELYKDWLSGFDTEKANRMRTAFHEAGLDTLTSYSTKQIFTKIESLVKNHNTVAGRLIFKGTDLYNMLSGPIFMELMKRFVQCSNSLDTCKFKIAYKQSTPEIVDHLESIRSATHVEADFSANDKSQVQDVQDLELLLMKRLGCPSWFLRLHRRTNKYNVYNTKYGLASQICYQLPSGCTDGTFRNTFWNLTLFHTWCVKRKIRNARVCFLGDDMIAALPKRPRLPASSYENHCKRAHMVAKVTSFRSLSQGHFLSKHFYPSCQSDAGHVMLPFVGKVLAKFNTRPNANHGVTDDQYMAGKALSHAYEFRHCHVLADLFRKRATHHLGLSGGKFSVLAVSYHVRQFAQWHPGGFDFLLTAFDEDVFPNLLSRDELDDFWQGAWGITYGEMLDMFGHVILGYPSVSGWRLLFASSSIDLG